MKPKLKAALYVLYSFLVAIIGFGFGFGFLALMTMTRWGFWVVGGGFTGAMIYGAYKAFYEIFKDE
jgi:hypothetical protein